MLGLWGNCLVISVFRALQTHYRGIPVTNANEGTKKDACNQWFSEAGRFHILGRSGVRPVGAFALQTRTRGEADLDQWEMPPWLLLNPFRVCWELNIISLGFT